VAAVVLWLAFAPDMGTQTAGEPVEGFLHLHGLDIAPWVPDEVYVSTHQGLIRIDSDGAWRYVSEEPHDFMGFAADPTEPDVLYSSGHPAPGSGLANPIGFMVSTDAGVAWTPRALQGQVDFHAMAVQPSDGQVVYGWDAAGGLQRSTDAGQNWRTVAAGLLEQAAGALSLAVDADDPDRVLAGTQVALLESRDGGTSWTPLLELSVTAVVTVADDPDRVVAYAATANDGLLESTDGGATWTPLGLVVTDDAGGHLAVHPTDPDTIYAGTFGEDLYRTLDGGGSWEKLAEAGQPGTPDP
jgi:photosystem II stability/assembly factor-like uncharacterized protein